MASSTIPKSYDAPVLIVGGGPVGMLLAYQLDRLEIPCILLEQNASTTQWPKMDLTNSRSMELLRFLGLADEYRKQDEAVPGDSVFNSMFITDLTPDGRVLGSFGQPCVSSQRENIKKNNDGSRPAEPEQRCSQIVFEAWLKRVIEKKSRIDCRFGWKYTGHVEQGGRVISTVLDPTGARRTISSRYLVGCDGGKSSVRKNAQIRMIGGPMPMELHLVHFKSQDLAKKLPHGRFWHAFFPTGGFVIDQDADCTFTAHYPVAAMGNGDVDPREIVYRTIGGIKGRYMVTIDEMLVQSTWRPNFSIAESYATSSLNVLLAGDAAHCIPPHGGHGMNSGVVDAIGLGWRLAALVKGYGGDLLLQSYTTERKTAMIRCLKRSHEHVLGHISVAKLYPSNLDLLADKSERGNELRRRLKEHIDGIGPETMEHGIELDVRYSSSIIYADNSPEPVSDLKRYIPSTRPGARAPHVFLKDGTTSTYDLLGKGWTLVRFIDEHGSSDDPGMSTFARVARRLNIPLTLVRLSGEGHVRRIWERDTVLVRPDTHVAWRGQHPPTDASQVETILQVVTGRQAFRAYNEKRGEHHQDQIRQIFEAFAG